VTAGFDGAEGLVAAAEMPAAPRASPIAIEALAAMR
jgi:hypothetical protein